MPLNFLPAQAEIIVPRPEKNGMMFRIKQKMAKPRDGTKQQLTILKNNYRSDYI